MKTFVGLTCLFCHSGSNRVDELCGLLVRQFVDAESLEALAYVLLLNHETNEEVFVRKLFFIALGIEAVEHVVVLHGRVAAYCLKTAVMVGEYKAVGRYNHARAEAAKEHYRVLDGVLAAINVVVRKTETVRFHLVVNSLWQVVERPHSFVSMSHGGSRHER